MKQSRAMFPGCVQFYRLKERTADLRNLDVPAAVLFRIGEAGSGVSILHNFIAVHGLCSKRLYYEILLLDTAHFLTCT